MLYHWNDDYGAGLFLGLLLLFVVFTMLCPARLIVESLINQISAMVVLMVFNLLQVLVMGFSKEKDDR